MPHVVADVITYFVLAGIFLFVVVVVWQEFTKKPRRLGNGETCAECRRPIASDETPHLNRNSVICETCVTKIKGNRACPRCGSKLTPKKVRWVPGPVMVVAIPGCCMTMVLFNWLLRNGGCIEGGIGGYVMGVAVLSIFATVPTCRACDHKLSPPKLWWPLTLLYSWPKCGKCGSVRAAKFCARCGSVANPNI